MRELLREELAEEGALVPPDGFAKDLVTQPDANPVQRLEARIFAGELAASDLRRLAEIATAHAEGVMTLTCDQNMAFYPRNPADGVRVAAALAKAGFDGKSREERVPFRVCPGSHECRLGLVATRDVARAVLAAVGEKGEGLSWAIAGCPNSCTQPQLAEVGIIAVKLVKDEDGERTPRFDLYRRADGTAFGSPVRQGITLAGLIESARELG